MARAIRVRGRVEASAEESAADLAARSPWVREIREGEAGHTLASSPDTVSSDPGTMR